MIINDVVTGIVAIIIGYFLGSIPSAYIAGRLIKKQDIRKMGGGNVGARNTFHEVGKVTGLTVGVLDITKGAAAIAIAMYLLDAGLIFVLATGLAAVAGHIWSLYLKFTGGNGLATTVGVFTVLLPWEILIALGIALVLVLFTRNPILSVNLSLISVPVSSRFLEGTWDYTIFSLILMVVMVMHFLPTIRNAVLGAGTRENFVNDLLRRNRTKGE